MIVSHRSFGGKISDKQIIDAADRYGYDNYLPKEIVRDLFSAWTWVLHGENILECTQVGYNTGDRYSTAFSDFLQFIISKRGYIHMGITDGFMFAFAVLNDCHRYLNLREMENAKLYGMEFEINHDGAELNYAFDLSEIDPDIMHFLDVRSCNYPINQIGLDDDVKDVLKYYNGLTTLKGDVTEEPVVIREKMSAYSQIAKSPKHRWVYPTFQLDYALKNLNVNIPTLERYERLDATLLIDISTSTMVFREYINLYKAMLLFLYSTFKDTVHRVTVHFFSNSIVKTINLQTREDIDKLYKTEIEAYVDVAGWDGMLKYVEKHHRGETLILVTDGPGHSIDYTKMRENVWNIISLRPHRDLAGIASYTNGKFIKV